MADPRRPDMETTASIIWGMMVDEYNWPANWVWDSINIEIRKNSREFKKTPEYSSSWNNASGRPNAFIPDSYYFAFTHNGYFDTTFNLAVYKNKSTTSWSAAYQNYIKFWWKDLVLSKKFIHQFTLDTSSYTQWVGLRWSYLSPDFPDWYTWGTWWTKVWSQRQHTSWWWTWTLAPTTPITPTIWTYYRLYISHNTCTTGSCAITFWWVTFWTIDSSSNKWYSILFKTATSGSWNLTFTPTNDYDWRIYNVVLVNIQNVAEEQWTFTSNTSYRPFLNFHWTLLIWDWSYISYLWYTWWAFAPVSWTLPTKINLTNSWETVIWIFELGDQVVFFTDKAQYFWDWFNTEYDRRVPRDDTIVAVTQYKTIFYVATQNTADTILWKTSNGYDRVMIFKDESYSDWDTPRRFQINDNNPNSNMMTMVWPIMYLVWDGYPLNWELHTYWAFNPWMPESFSRLCCSDSSWYVTALWKSTYWQLVAGMASGTTYWWIYLETHRDYTVWYANYPWTVMFKPTIWNLESTNKEAQKIRVWYKFKTQYDKLLIHAKVNDEINQVSFYCPWSTITTVPTVWAIYTWTSNTLTITWVWSDSNKETIITWSFTWWNWFSNIWTLTKSSWTWDATIAYIWQYPVRTLDVITWSNTTHLNSKRYSKMYNQPFNKIQMWFTSHSSSWSSTPTFYDFILEYNEILNDL